MQRSVRGASVWGVNGAMLSARLRLIKVNITAENRSPAGPHPHSGVYFSGPLQSDASVGHFSTSACMAIRTSSGTLRACIFSIMRALKTSTVRGLMPRSSAISRFGLPATTSCMT